MLLKTGLYDDELEIDEIINKSIDIFKLTISEKLNNDNFSISKMSDTNLDIERVRDMSFIPSIKDCEDLIYKNAIYPDNVLN
ncbi:hypothetical protein ACFLY2_01720 [Patescibacteria group bacterium]